MKKATDILAMVFTVVAIVTGFILHREVHHLFVYDDTALWTVHEVAGILLAVFVGMHFVQHKMWFKNYSKIRFSRKYLNSLLFILVVAAVISGFILFCGSHSQFVSIFHYITAIAFTVVAIVHVVNRWNIFKKI